eukprot:scaffold249325_cov30-Tisochrysis_lutea.AAC.13
MEPQRNLYRVSTASMETGFDHERCDAPSLTLTDMREAKRSLRENEKSCGWTRTSRRSNSSATTSPSPSNSWKPTSAGSPISLSCVVSLGSPLGLSSRMLTRLSSSILSAKKICEHRHALALLREFRDKVPSSSERVGIAGRSALGTLCPTPAPAISSFESCEASSLATAARLVDASAMV